MKVFSTILVVVSCFCAFGKGLPPEIVLRNGLSDAQIDAIFASKTNAQLKLTARMWQNMNYRIHRFDNMREWLNLGIEGKLGDRILEVSDARDYFRDAAKIMSNRWENAQKDIEYLNVIIHTKDSDLNSLSNAFNNLMHAYCATTQRVDNATANLRAKRAEIQAKYDKASAITKPIYKISLDIIDGILEKLEPKKEEGDEEV